MLTGDLRLAVRLLFRNPGFSAIALLALALGIGANSAIFSVVNTLLLRPMAYADPERLVVAEHAGPSPVAPATFLDWKQQATSFKDLAAAQSWGGALRSVDKAEALVGLRVSASMFSMLGVPPLKGRTFSQEDGRDGAEPVVVISHSLWQRSFGGAADIVGRSIVIDDTPFTITGVMPASFQFAPFWVTQAEIWAPFVFGDRRADRIGKSIRVFGRLKRGVSLEQAQAEMSAIMGRLAQQYPDSSAKETVSIVPLRDRVVGSMRPLLLVLLGTVGFVLLIACANVANLMLARATGRKREMAVRLAMGASRWRMARQAIVESGLLGLLGGGFGLGLAWTLLQALQAILPPATLPRQNEIELDWLTVAFTATVSLLTGLVAGLLPAWQASRGDVNDALKEGGRSGSSGRNTHRARTGLVVAEMALAFVLLIGAGLMARSFTRLLAIDPGFNPSGLITAQISIAGTKQADPARRAIFYRDVIERITHQPGVRSASAINHAPIAGDVWGAQFQVEGRPDPAPGEAPGAVYRVALPGYFGVMGTSFVGGRDFDYRDTLDAPRVVIVNESLARKHWPGEEAIGRRMGFKRDGSVEWFTIAGVVRDLKQADWQSNPRDELYFSLLQNPEYLSSPGRHFQFLSLVVRLKTDSAARADVVRDAVSAIDPHVVVSNLLTMEEAVAINTWRPRLSLFLLGGFGILGLVLAITGVYGVISQSVSQRTREIGIRMALGARRSDVVSQSLLRSLSPLCAGIFIGLFFAGLLSKLMRTMLFGVESTDPLTYVTVAAVMLASGLFAAFWPALRVALIDPLKALRHD